MGCCCLGRPSTDILNDPSVTACATVGHIAILGRYSRTVIKGCCSGLMYIREDRLHYDAVCSGRLYCQCCRREFSIGDITSVEVVDNQVERSHGTLIVLNPGLKIIVQPRSGAFTIIIVAMPDAREFAAQLNSRGR